MKIIVAFLFSILIISTQENIFLLMTVRKVQQVI